jgi:hypothetical protein
MNRNGLMMRLGFAALISAGMCVAAAAQGTAPMKDDLFAGTEKFAAGATHVEEITMDPNSLDMVNGRNSTRAHTMVLNVVREYRYDKEGMYKTEDVDEFRKKLETGDWRCSVHVRDLKTNTGTDICGRVRTDGLIEQAIIESSPKSLTFIHTIRRPASKDDKGGPSGLVGMWPLDGMSPETQAELAVLSSETEARMLAMEPLMEARLSTIGPEIDARLAGLDGKIAPLLMHMDREMKIEIHPDVKIAPLAPLQPAAPSEKVAPVVPGQSVAPAAPAQPQ